MNRKTLLRKAILATVGQFAVLAAPLFVPAGTPLWLAGWVFLAVFCGYSLVIVRMLIREDPELLAERLSLPIQRRQPLWDKLLVSGFLPLFVAWLILMSLDAVRFGWSEVPVWLQTLGALGLILSFYVVYSTVRENPYLAVVAKLQEDRGQSVVRTGPYRYVRHPMYSGMLIFFPATALLLGSWWGLLVSPAFMALLVVRAALEERMLKRGLEGYTDYTRTVKYRLIPRVW